MLFGASAETFVRADGSFIPFADDFDMSTVTTSVKGVGEIGEVKMIDLQSPISSLIGQQVMKVGRSSGLTAGTVLAYALEYNDEKGICFLTDFLVVGENQQTFDLEGDSGSLIMFKSEKPRPIGIIWGGTANRGRLKLKVGQPPENWTSGVDLGRLLNLLELDLIISDEGLKGLCPDRCLCCWYQHVYFVSDLSNYGFIIIGNNYSNFRHSCPYHQKLLVNFYANQKNQDMLSLVRISLFKVNRVVLGEVNVIVFWYFRKIERKVSSKNIRGTSFGS